MRTSIKEKCAALPLAMLTALALATAVQPFASSSAAPQDTQPRRHGRVLLGGHTLVDDAGPFLGLGVTFFWALWGEAHDAARLEQNLAWLAARRVDYVRILAMVGGESWEDRRIDPAAPDYWPTVDRFLARAARHGLRVQVTVFAGAQVMMPARDARQQFIDRWIARLNQDVSRFVMIEVANEHVQNGIEDIAELRHLGERLAGGTDVLVALSAPAEGRVCDAYAKSAADLATMHYSREWTDRAGPWAPVWQPITYPGAFDRACPGQLPVAVNNEPIGPTSSVAEDGDPLRLTAAFVATFLGQHAAYVLHTGAGVRGGGAADRERGRPANLFETPGLAEALEGMRQARTYSPIDLPNWRRVPVDDAAFPLAGMNEAIARRDAAHAHGAERDGRFVLLFLGVRRPLQLQARQNLVLDMVEPDTGVLKTLEAQSGQEVTLSPRPRDQWGDAVVVLARPRQQQ